ncbi:hypothetical protein NYP80_04475 [Erwinia pyrifoliae]|uniref:hypothetical protein n=2 Tax=Erwinia pyrifoliae TaxID=79967 RepID=UPI0021C17AC8|nr:hypothetical protein [Erwinia pyrifoliae]UXK13130.1 hypothetical protein NYP80_04475 [Erwinia pyrifoliae]
MNYMPLDPIKLTNEGSILTQSTGRKSYASATASKTFVGNIMNVDNSPQDMGGATSRKDNAFRHDLLVETVTHAQKPTIGEKGENTPTRFVHRLELGSFIVGNILSHERTHNLSNSSTKEAKILDIGQKIDNFLNCKQYAEVESLLNGHEKKSGFEWAYAKLLKGYAYSGDVERAELTFEKLRQIANVTTPNCNSMMRGYSTVGDHEMAEKLLARMYAGDLKTDKIKPDNKTYECLIYAYLYSPSLYPWNKLAGAEYALSRAYSEDLRPENGVLISLLKDCQNNNNKEVAKKILSYMPKDVFNSLLIQIKNPRLKNFIMQVQADS